MLLPYLCTTLCFLSMARQLGKHFKMDKHEAIWRHQWCLERPRRFCHCTAAPQETKKLPLWLVTAQNIHKKNWLVCFWNSVIKSITYDFDFQDTKVTKKNLDFEFRDLNSKSPYRRFWIQKTEFKIIIVDFEFRKLNSKSSLPILNSENWIQNHHWRFWIRKTEFKIIIGDFEFWKLNSKSIPITKAFFGYQTESE